MNKVELLKKKRCIAFSFLHYWTKFLGINPLSVSTNGDLEKTRIGIFYNCFLSGIYFYVFYKVTNTRFGLSLIDETPISLITDYFGLLWQFSENLAVWIIFAFSQKRIILIVKNFVKIERISEKLGTSNNHEITNSQIVYNLIIVNFVYLTTIMFTNAVSSYWSDDNLLLWIIFYVPTLASFNATMLYVMGLLIVKRKFKFLNEKLRDLVNNESANHCPNSKGIPRYDYDSLSNKILLISQLHRELRNVIDQMKKHIGVPVLLDIGNNFTYMTLTTYAFYRHLKSSEVWTTPSNLLFFIVASHWIIRPILMFLLISNVAGSTLKEANNSANLLHTSLNSRNVYEKSPKYLVQLNIFSLELLNNKLNISVFGLLKLDHFFFYSMIATSTSYLVIMLQFSD